LAEQKVRWQCPCGAVWPVSRVHEPVACPRCRLAFDVVPQGDYLLLKVTRQGWGRSEARRVSLDVTGLSRRGRVIGNKREQGGGAGAAAGGRQHRSDQPGGPGIQ